VMPTFQGQLSEEEVLSLLHYLKSLVPAAADSTRLPSERGTS